MHHSHYLIANMLQQSDGTVSSFGSGVQSTMYKMSMHTKETWKTFDVFLSSKLLIKNKLAAVFLWVSYPTEVEIVSYSDTLSIAWDFGSKVESKQLLEVPTELARRAARERPDFDLLLFTYSKCSSLSGIKTKQAQVNVAKTTVLQDIIV